jgi:DNA polymerase sigma
MPYLKKGDNDVAMSIHEHYQNSSDQQAFLRAARQFLSQEKSRSEVNSNGSHIRTQQPTQSISPDVVVSTGHPSGNSHGPIVSSNNQLTSAQVEPSSISMTTSVGQSATVPMSFHNLVDSFQQGSRHSVLQPGEGSPRMEILEQKMQSLLSDDDDIVIMPTPFPITGQLTIGPSSFAAARQRSPPIHSLFPSISQAEQLQQLPPLQHHHYQQQQAHQHQQNHYQDRNAYPPNLESHPNGSTPGSQSSTSQPMLGSINSTPVSSEAFSSPFMTSGSINNNDSIVNKGHSPFFQTQQSLQDNGHSTAVWSLPANTDPTEFSNSIQFQQVLTSPPSPKQTSPEPATAPETPGLLDLTMISEAFPTKTPKKEYQPKRLWTHLEDQPGKILANNVAPSTGTVVDLRPRQELTARWMLPMSFLQEKAREENIQSIRELLKKLSVGLFRRGCTENGSQASIVSKEILAPDGESRDDYPFQITQTSVVGSVPFYSPRTPGHVVFRLYWHDNPLHTLATGPTLNVRVTENDFESSIRFILSNFKAKKVNPTSLSSLNSLTLVLEQYQVMSNKPSTNAEGAGRAVWGCVCEARKVLDACAIDYHKTTAKLEKLEESVDELKEKVAAEEEGKRDPDREETDDDSTRRSVVSSDGELSSNAAALREKTKALMSGRASCERKWRDSQLAFASILKAIVSNPSMALLLRRELITKLRLEYELWCPLCEEFAVPGDSTDQMWYEPLNIFTQPITADHFRICTEARSKMQVKILGFDPNTTRLENILYPSRGRNRQMNPVAVNVFNQLSSSMGQLYQDVYFTADRILQQREAIRAHTEKLVALSNCFPPGTKVAIFGSSANGFGSPKSDLDMCLQIPSEASVVTADDPTGAKAMATLSQIFENNGMKDVDTARLTARIPVIKFNCPRGHDPERNPDEDAFVECDLSMHNPLAVLNTALLRTYAEINPVSRVLASVIKRWAKARDINNPARHTLSSYGYILMLIHFLTYHQRSGNGLVSPIGKSARNQAMPLLPNLHWMSEMWPESPSGTPYTEYSEIPKKIVQHPLEENAKVNTYFYRPSGAMLNKLQRLFPGQDLSLAILLASFFRYYAYEFDYKRHVVSLHSTVAHGLVEREVKAELDGWRNYSAALTIEDPFETFYDVAHVLRGGYYHRIRREFAVAYSKIADVATGQTSSSWNNRVVDLTNMSGMELIDWICEPVVTTDREEFPIDK